MLFLLNNLVSNCCLLPLGIDLCSRRLYFTHRRVQDMDSLIVHRDLGLQVGLGGLLTFLPLLVHSRLGLNL